MGLRERVRSRFGREEPEPRSPRPERVATIRRAEGLLALAQAHLPRKVHSKGEFEDWGIVAPALVHIVADLAEGVMAAPAPRGRVRAEVLARSLCEYTISFGWLAGTDDEGERLNRLRSLVKDEFTRRSRVENQMRDQIGSRVLYLKRRGPKLPEEFLDQATRARLASLKGDPSIPQRPGSLDAAFAADEFWMPTEEPIERFPFAYLYLLMFAEQSFTTHPTITAISRVVTGSIPDALVGHAELLGDADGPYGLSLVALTQTLIVSSHVLGWPDRAAIDAACER
jgi:hypothetical protein